MKEEKKKKSEGKEVKTKKARAVLAAGRMLQPFATVLRVEMAIAYNVERCAIGYEGWMTLLCTAELPPSGFAAKITYSQNKSS